jgi:hypothetical protein
MIRHQSFLSLSSPSSVLIQIGSTLLFPSRFGPWQLDTELKPERCLCNHAFVVLLNSFRFTSLLTLSPTLHQSGNRREETAAMKATAKAKDDL